MDAKLNNELCSIVAAIIRVKSMVKHPESVDRLWKAEWAVLCVKDEECPNPPMKLRGHHGG